MELVEDLNEQIKLEAGITDEDEEQPITAIEYRMLMQKYGVINPQLLENDEAKFFLCCMISYGFRARYQHKQHSKSTWHAMNKLLSKVPAGRTV